MICCPGGSTSNQYPQQEFQEEIRKKMLNWLLLLSGAMYDISYLLNIIDTKQLLNTAINIAPDSYKLFFVFKVKQN